MAKRRKTPIWRRQRPKTKIKRKIAKVTGIPTTKSGRKAKLRRACMPGCAMSVTLIAAIISLAVALFTLCPFPAEAAVTLAGDLNCDGRITIADAVLLNRLIAEDSDLPLTAQGIENADCDADGFLSILDVRSSLVLAAKEAPATTAVTTTTAASTTTTTVTTAAATQAPATDPPAIVTAPAGPVYTQIGTLMVSPYPFIVRRNEEVTLNVIGLPNTEYDINVYYSSSVSKAAGLDNKVSDGSGNVSWSWKIGGKTNSGNYHIDLIGGGVKTKMVFSVVD